MPKLSNDKDRSKVQSLGDSGGGFFKLEDGHNFIVLLDEEYEHGYIHWVRIGDNNIRRTCLAGIENKGWAPDDCPLCELALEKFELKKEACPIVPTTLPPALLPSEWAQSSITKALLSSASSIIRAIPQGTP